MAAAGVVVRIVYGTLAGLMLVGFVFFGIGSDVSFDCAGAFEGDDGPTATQFQSQIDDAEKKLAKDPKDEDALTDIARYRYLAGNSLVEPSDDGTTLGTINEDVRSEWSQALDAWEKYLKTDPKQPDPVIAGQMLCAYDPTACGYGGADTELIDFDGAAAVVEVLAEDDPRPEYFGQVAYYRYADGDLEGGKEAADEALAEASGKDREAAPEAARRAREAGDQARRGADARAPRRRGEGGLGTPGGSPLSSPFGSGSGSGAAPPPGAVRSRLTFCAEGR